MSRAAHAYVREVRAQEVRKLQLVQARGVAIADEKRVTRARDVAAFEAMCADRKLAPRKPPRMPANLPERVTPGMLALRRDKVLGVYEEPRR